jgi:hypothetical protein
MQAVLKQIGGGKYASKAKMLSWIGTNYSVDTEPLSDMTRDQLLNVAQKLWADGMGARSDEDDEEDVDSDSGSDSDGGSSYTSDALENQFSLISFSGSFKAPSKPLSKAKALSRARGKAEQNAELKTQVKADLKATPEPHAMKKPGKSKSAPMRTTRSRAKAQQADLGTFSNSDSDPVIKTHSLKRFAAV